MFSRNGKSKNQTQKVKNPRLNPNAMIVVEKTKKRIFRHIPERYLPSDSFVKQYKKGDWLHILGLDKQGKFWAIMPNPAEANRMPGDLYMAKNCADEVEECYGLSTPTVEKIKWGIFIGLIIAILIVVFLMTASAGGVR